MRSCTGEPFTDSWPSDWCKTQKTNCRKGMLLLLCHLFFCAFYKWPSSASCLKVMLPSFSKLYVKSSFKSFNFFKVIFENSLSGWLDTERFKTGNWRTGSGHWEDFWLRVVLHFWNWNFKMANARWFLVSCQTQLWVQPVVCSLSWQWS